MKKILWLSFIVIPLLLSIHACISSHDYSQTYTIVINRLEVGKEIVSEKTDLKGDLVCLSEEERDTYGSKEKKRRTTRTKMVFEEGKQFPVSYSYESNSGTSYELKVEGGQIVRTIQNKEESRESIAPLEPGMVMLDLNAFHTIDFWIRKYDVKKGGRQVIQTYLLPAGSTEKLSVIPADISIPEHETEALQLKNYEIEMGEGMAIILWVDKDNRLYRLYFRGPNLEVIRSDLYERLAAKEKDIKREKP